MKHRVLVSTILAASAVLILPRANAQEKMPKRIPGIVFHRMSVPPYPPIDPDTVGDCTAGEISRVVKVYLKAGFAENLAPSSTNPMCNTCLKLATASAQSDDDVPSNETAASPPDTYASTAVHTPFDVNLTPLWSTYASSSKHRPLLIKIVIQDPSIEFYRPNTTPPSADSSWAVIAGRENSDMFYCRSEIKSETRKDDTGKEIKESFVTVRARWMESGSVTGPALYSGLNIGILLPRNKSKSSLRIPVYIDPIFKGNG